MLIVNKNESFAIPFHLCTYAKGDVDITSATVTCNIKETPQASVIAIQKVSTDTAQIAKTYAAKGMGIVKVLAANTSALTKRDYYYEITDGTHKIAGFLRFNQNSRLMNSDIALHGTTAEMTALGLTLTSADRTLFYNDDESALYVWSGTEWT